MGANNTAADDHDPRRANTGYAAHQHAATAIGLLQRPCTNLRCKATCDF